MKKLSLMLIVVLSLMVVSVVGAQDTIEPDTMIRGEITNDAFEFEYTFEGVEDQIIVIEMRSRDDEDSYTDLAGEIILLDGDGQIVTDTSESFSPRDKTLVTQLPFSGNFTILATREEGRSGDTEGQFTLELIFPTVLKVGDKITAETTSDSRLPYFVVSASNDFILRYNHVGGDFRPEINVATIDENNADFEDYAVATGKFDNLMMGDFEADTYIVYLRRALGSFIFGEVSVEFNLTIDPLES